MLQYSNLTAKDAYEEVMFRSGRHRNAINADYDTVLGYLNWGVIDSLSKTLPYKDWAYVGRLIVQNRTAMPLDYIGVIRVLLSDGGAPPYNEARYVAPKEYNQLSNWRHAHAWNKGYVTSPIYTIWSDRVVALTQLSPLSIYLYPNTEDVIGTPPTNLFYPTVNVTGTMEYYQAPPPVVTDMDVLPIPYEFEDLVIWTALFRLLSSVADANIEQLYLRIMEESTKLIERFQEKKRTEKRELDSFQEPVIPEVPPQPEQGEAAQNLQPQQ